jgi:hypothetical protein
LPRKSGCTRRPSRHRYFPRQLVAQGGVLLVQPPHRSKESALVYPARRNVEREFSPSTLDPSPVDGHDRVIGLSKGGHDGGLSRLVQPEPTVCASSGESHVSLSQIFFVTPSGHGWVREGFASRSRTGGGMRRSPGHRMPRDRLAVRVRRVRTSTPTPRMRCGPSPHSQTRTLSSPGSFSQRLQTYASVSDSLGDPRQRRRGGFLGVLGGADDSSRAAMCYLHVHEPNGRRRRAAAEPEPLPATCSAG